MKEGDLIRTSWHIPDIPIVPPAGDSYPLGAISPGTKVCLESNKDQDYGIGRQADLGEKFELYLPLKLSSLMKVCFVLLLAVYN